MEKLYQEKESKPCLRIVLEKDKTQYEALNQKCFSNHPSFWISAEVLNWNPSDDKSFILGFFNETELISYIKVNLFHSKSDLLTRLLGFPEQAVPQDIQFPAMYIARAATSPDYMRKGYYTKLRRILLELGYSFQIRYVCNTLIEEEPRVDSLVRAGFIFFRNPVKWNTAKYRSSNFALVGFLDMFKNKEKFLFSDDPEAMHFIKSQKSQFKDWLYNYLRPSTTGATELQFHYTKNNHYKFGFSKKFFFFVKACRINSLSILDDQCDNHWTFEPSAR
jgi:hypothetical protein